MTTEQHTSQHTSPQAYRQSLHAGGDARSGPDSAQGLAHTEGMMMNAANVSRSQLVALTALVEQYESKGYTWCRCVLSPAGYGNAVRCVYTVLNEGNEGPFEGVRILTDDGALTIVQWHGALYNELDAATDATRYNSAVLLTGGAFVSDVVRAAQEYQRDAESPGGYMVEPHAR